MIRSDVAADIITQIQACLPDFCSYTLLRSRALPPADCDTIALVWGDRSSRRDEDCFKLEPCGQRTIEQELHVVITKCCVTPDTADSFDTSAEDTETICFERDLQVLEDCLECADWRQLGLDHGITSLVYEGTRRDMETEGGCMSAYLKFLVTSEECCPAPVPPLPVLDVSLFTAQNVVRITGAGLATTETIEWTTTGSSGTFTILQPPYNVEALYFDPDVITINMDPGDTLTDLVLRDSGSNIIATWSGGLLLVPADEPNVSGTVVPGDDSGEFTIYGHYFLTAALGAVDSFTLTLDSQPDRVYYVPGSPNAGLNPPNAVVGVVQDNEVTIIDPDAAGMDITNVNVKDVDNDYDETFNIVPDVTIP